MIWDPIGEVFSGGIPYRIDSFHWGVKAGHRNQASWSSFEKKVRAALRERLGAQRAKAFDSLLTAVECLHDELGIDYADGHHENVMARRDEDGNRELVYLDLGHSSGPGAILPVMEEAR